jgi:flagellar basal-body rod protein FlgB
MKLQLLTALTEKMRWHQTRQTLLAENVANAETPGYRGKDLKAFSIEDRMSPMSAATMSTAATQPGHFSVSAGGTGGFDSRDLNSFEITPEGNGITLEDEMIKVSANQVDYQTITALYTRSLKLIRTALGKQA